MNNVSLIHDKRWSKLFTVTVILLVSLLQVSCQEENRVLGGYVYAIVDENVIKNTIYEYYGVAIYEELYLEGFSSGYREDNQGCVYKVYGITDRLKTAEGLRQLIIENPKIAQEDKNNINHIKNPLVYYLNQMSSNSKKYAEVEALNQGLDTTKTFHVLKEDNLSLIITPWIKLSDLTPQRLSIESDEDRKTAYQAYQICRDFFVDPKPGLNKDLFHLIHGHGFKEMLFSEKFIHRKYAKQYSKADFIEVLSAPDTLVRYGSDCDIGGAEFFNQRKQLVVKLRFDALGWTCRAEERTVKR